MCNSAWCDLNKTGTVLNLHDMCHNPNFNCQKQITFTPKQFQGGSIKIRRWFHKKKLKSIFKGTKTAWDKFLKPALNMASPYFCMAVSAKTKNPQTCKATSDIFKSSSGGKILSVKDMHGRGLRLKGM